jgi:5-enolpyruvylshikimate-3-phosphate synthase
MTSLLVDPADRALMGDLTVPGDKSIGHRALLFSLLARGRMRIRGLGDGADNGRSAKAITQLGAKVTRDGAHVVVDGPGLRTLVAPTGGIDCGNSGTTIRLLCGMVAGAPFATTLHGDESLSQRPMRRVIEPLTQMGAVLRGEARGKDVVPPLIVGPATGPLRAIRLRAAGGVGPGQDRGAARGAVGRRRLDRDRAGAGTRSHRAPAALPRRADHRRRRARDHRHPGLGRRPRRRRDHRAG